MDVLARVGQSYGVALFITIRHSRSRSLGCRVIRYFEYMLEQWIKWVVGMLDDFDNYGNEGIHGWFGYSEEEEYDYCYYRFSHHIIIPLTKEHIQAYANTLSEADRAGFYKELLRQGTDLALYLYLV